MPLDREQNVEASAGAERTKQGHAPSLRGAGKGQVVPVARHAGGDRAYAVPGVQPAMENVEYGRDRLGHPAVGRPGSSSTTASPGPRPASRPWTPYWPLPVLASIAEFERDLIRERVIAGIRRARAQGRRLGRPRIHQGGHGPGQGHARPRAFPPSGTSVVELERRRALLLAALGFPLLEPRTPPPVLTALKG